MEATSSWFEKKIGFPSKANATELKRKLEEVYPKLATGGDFLHPNLGPAPLQCVRTSFPASFASSAGDKAISLILQFLFTGLAKKKSFLLIDCSLFCRGGVENNTSFDLFYLVLLVSFC